MTMVAKEQMMRPSIPLIFASVAVGMMCIGFFFGLKRNKVKKFLNGQPQWIRLIDKVLLTPDTYRFKFQFSEGKCVFGLPCGQHIRIYAPNRLGKVPGEWNGKPDRDLGLEEMSRPYTPVSPGETSTNYVDIICKVYRPHPPNFVDGGKISMFMENLKIDDQIKILGPVGKTIWHGRGLVSFQKVDFPFKKYIGLVAGGSGITPILQVLHKSFADPLDSTQFWLIYANKTPDDIIERNFLEELQEMYPGRFHLWFVVDQTPDTYIGGQWSYSEGYVTEQILKDHLPAPTNEALVMMCGPRPMIVDAVKPALEKLGWITDQFISF